MSARLRATPWFRPRNRLSLWPDPEPTIHSTTRSQYPKLRSNIDVPGRPLTEALLLEAAYGPFIRLILDKDI